jgi:DNA-directed RNA polymerase I subunit RPA49
VSVSKDAQKNGLLPLFASTPAISLTEDTSFTLYRGAEGSSSSKGKEKERLVPSMLHGESSKLEWTSTNRLHGLSETGEPLPETDEMVTECSASYALALYDPSTSSLSVINAPLHILSHIPKRLKALPSMISDAPSVNGNAAARAELGLSFGTKKSIKAIRAAERNKVDAGAADLQSLQDVMMQDLSKGLETLPEGVGGTPRKIGGLMNEEELEAAKTSELQQVVEAAKKTGRPVPDVGAILPEQVYKIIGEVILEKELEAINVSGMMKVSSDQKEEAIRMLPYKLSHWVNDRIKELVQNSPKDKKRKLRVLVWISGLMAIKNMGKQGIDPTKEMDLKKRFGGGMSGNVLPPACSASLLERFAETIRGSKK